MRLRYEARGLHTGCYGGGIDGQGKLGRDESERREYPRCVVFGRSAARFDVKGLGGACKLTGRNLLS